MSHDSCTFVVQQIFVLFRSIQFAGNECLEKHTVSRLKMMAIPQERLLLALLNRRLAGLQQEKNIMLALIQACLTV